MATIKALEGRTVHQIQSGQVIVDLCSVVKELVENSLDAGATAIEVRFRNNGLDSVEVQDNGVGISSDNYESVALKHYTSKLTDYDDLASLQTFGFRGEALSSLCALSKFHIISARADQAPKGTRLDFDVSGKLKATSIVASQKGTTVTVEDLFLNLPVRRRELEKNIKREYGKVLGILQAYACISINLKLSTSNVMAKGKKAMAFATNSNLTTRENIANVFGTKALQMLLSVDLHLDLQPTTARQSASENKKVQISGHVSKPVFGEGRSAPDRQMFFVNARPCSLPQVAKVFNEVYRSYNISQSPFIFANIIIDTNAYDVNVSPDKRTIMLHDQNILLESLRASLIDLFESQDQTIPLTQKNMKQMPLFKQLSIRRESSRPDSSDADNEGEEEEEKEERVSYDGPFPDCREDQVSSNTKLPDLIARFAGRGAKDRGTKNVIASESGNGGSRLPKDNKSVDKTSNRRRSHGLESGEGVDSHGTHGLQAVEPKDVFAPAIKPCDRPVESPGTEEWPMESHSSPGHFPNIEKTASQVLAVPSHGVVPNAFERMRPRRQSPEVATVTIGSKTASTVLGASIIKKRRLHPDSPPRSLTRSLVHGSPYSNHEVSERMLAFAAPGSGTVKVFNRKVSKVSKEDAPQLWRDDAGEADGGEQEVDGVEEGEDEEEDEEGYEDEQQQEEEQDVEKAHSKSGHALRAADNGSRSSPAGKHEPDHRRSLSPQDPQSNEEYVDEDEKKAREEIRVAKLIRNAEMTESITTIDRKRRAHQVLKGTGHKDSTTELVQSIKTSIELIDLHLNKLEPTLQVTMSDAAPLAGSASLTDTIAPEDRLTLTISKDDFASMHIIGQFNLGFILATRADTDMLIIDQHASDEKYNFERLQGSTVVQNQRLVHPQKLELTAVDEEIVLENTDALLKNGFQVEIDHSGSQPVGQRCKLLTLPMSKEVTFDASDLEELIALLADSPPISSSSSSYVPRPSKVRRMFAMRACRSSIMIGKTLTMRQMQGLIKHMGEIDKPWNCPHGRPTMRHLCSLADWIRWEEGDGLGGMEEQAEPIGWTRWVERFRVSSSDGDGTNEGVGNDAVDLATNGEEEAGDTIDADIEGGD